MLLGSRPHPDPLAVASTLLTPRSFVPVFAYSTLKYRPVRGDLGDPPRQTFVLLPEPLLIESVEVVRGVDGQIVHPVRDRPGTRGAAQFATEDQRVQKAKRAIGDPLDVADVEHRPVQEETVRVLAGVIHPGQRKGSGAAFHEEGGRWAEPRAGGRRPSPAPRSVGGSEGSPPGAARPRCAAASAA